MVIEMALQGLDGLPAPLNLTIWRGNTFERAFALKDNGQVADITGAAFVMTIGWNGGEIKKATADGGMSIDVPNAKVTLFLSAEETHSLPKAGKISYELEIWLDNYQNTFLAGSITAMGGLNSD